MVTLSRSSYRVILILVAILIVMAGVTYYVFVSPTGLKAREHADLTKVDEGEDVAYIALDGSTIDLKDFRGSTLLVNIWASWSPYTPADHERLKALKEKYGDSLTIIALNRKESKETALAYLDTIGKIDGVLYVIDTTDHFFNSLGGYAMPETILFDSVGNEKYRRRGTLDEGEVTAAIDTLIKE